MDQAPALKLFQLLQVLDAELTPKTCKVHLAGWTGLHNPLDVYLAGRFDDWQSSQSKKNFERPHVVALIQKEVMPLVRASLSHVGEGDRARRRCLVRAETK